MENFFSYKINNKDLEKHKLERIKFTITIVGENNLAGPLSCYAQGFSVQDKSIYKDPKTTLDKLQDTQLFFAELSIEEQNIKKTGRSDSDLVITMIQKLITKLKKDLRLKHYVCILPEHININANRLKHSRVIHPRRKAEKRLLTINKQFAIRSYQKVMNSYKKEHPEFSFSKHMGKATELHISEVKHSGYTKYHRRKLNIIEENNGVTNCSKFAVEIDSFENKELLQSIKVEDIYAGIDEVGVDSLVGPMVATIKVVVPNHGIDQLPVDSKNLSDSSITSLAKEIKKKSIFSATYSLSSTFVDMYGTGVSRTILLYACAIRVRASFPSIRIHIDGQERIEELSNTDYLIRGEESCYNISAASIYAKFICDELLRQIHLLAPKYSIDKHKGYGTVKHLQVIEKSGLSVYHRPNMSQKKLAKGYELPEIDLDIKLLKELVIELETLYKSYPKSFNEFRSGLLLRNKNSIIYKDIKPSKKIQYYLRDSYYEVIKKVEKTGVKITKKGFGPRTNLKQIELPKDIKKQVEFSVLANALNHIIRTAKERAFVFNEKDKNFLRAVYNVNYKYKLPANEQLFDSLREIYKKII
ncbi:hypothetical protein C1N61_32585 (plasmid) [Priestia aryabhattai]